MSFNLKWLFTTAVLTSALLLGGCRNNIDDYNDYKELNPTADRGDFFLSAHQGTQDQKPYFNVGSEHVQRTEEVYGYHYGYSFMRGEFCWHFGYHDEERENTPEETRQDKIAYQERLEIARQIDADHSRYLGTLDNAKNTIATLVVSKEFSYASNGDALGTDSLDCLKFYNDANKLAHIASENGLTFAFSDVAGISLPAKYDDAIATLVAETSRYQNDTLMIKTP